MAARRGRCSSVRLGNWRSTLCDARRGRPRRASSSSSEGGASGRPFDVIGAAALPDRACNGATWRFAMTIPEVPHLQMRCCETLFQLPKPIGNLRAGTLLFAASYLRESTPAIGYFASTDEGSRRSRIPSDRSRRRVLEVDPGQCLDEAARQPQWSDTPRRAHGSSARRNSLTLQRPRALHQRESGWDRPLEKAAGADTGAEHHQESLPELFIRVASRRRRPNRPGVGRRRRT